FSVGFSRLEYFVAVWFCFAVGKTESRLHLNRLVQTVLRDFIVYSSSRLRPSVLTLHDSTGYSRSLSSTPSTLVTSTLHSHRPSRLTPVCHRYQRPALDTVTGVRTSLVSSIILLFSVSAIEDSRDQRLGANVGSAQGPTDLGKYLMHSPTVEAQQQQTQSQPNSMGQQANATNMQQNQLIGQQSPSMQYDVLLNVKTGGDEFVR
ncbi:hypothetical protein Ccrd_025133, partial [Cynara cardunculus var. scolymus]